MFEYKNIEISRKKIIVFGTGEMGKNVIKTLDNSGLNIYYLIDNDNKKWGGEINKYVIKSPESLLKEDKKQILVLVSSMYFNEIYIQLKFMGFIEDEHFILAQDFLHYIDLKIELKKVLNRYNELSSHGDSIKAIPLLKNFLLKDPFNKEIILKLAKVYYENNFIKEAFYCIYQLKRIRLEDDLIINEIKRNSNNDNFPKKIVIFHDGDSKFLGDIIAKLEQSFVVKVISVQKNKQIDEGMEWADICWFEWCNKLIVYGSKHSLASQKKIICRLHSYEAFTDFVNQVKWSNVDHLIFVADYIKDLVLESINNQPKEVHVIPNGINMERLTFKNRNKGFNIAHVGYINFKKGPMLLLHAFKAIFDLDNRYKLFIAGQFQEQRYKLYFDQMIREWKLEKNIIFEGWQDNIGEWLEDKHFILSTSVLESQHLAIMEGMAKGIKPLVHNFVSAKKIYDSKYIWSTIDELKQHVNSEDYYSEEYRNFVNNNFHLEKQMDKIINILNQC